MTEKEIEDGLTSQNIHIRQRFAVRTDFTPTAAQFDRGLTDEDWWIRFIFAKRVDFTPTPAQIERGLANQDITVRSVFEARQAEWRAKWEVAELRKRHASVTVIKQKLEAL
jgi:hypothetical protein